MENRDYSTTIQPEKHSFNNELSELFSKKEITTIHNTLELWLKANCGITLKTVTMEEWESMNIEGKMKMDEINGEKTLTIVENLSPIEMYDILEIIGKNELYTEISEEAEKEKVEFCTLLQDASTYLEKYKTHLRPEEVEIATNMALRFREHASPVQNQEEQLTLPLPTSLTQERLDELDKWFIGEEIYNDRLKRLGENPTEEQKEELRIHLFQVYFRALTRETSETSTSMMGKFQDKIIESINEKVVEIPEKETTKYILEFAIKRLSEEMKLASFREKLLCDEVEVSRFRGEIDSISSIKTYEEYEQVMNALNLELSEQKQENLEELKIEAISKKQLEFATKIREIIMKEYKYETLKNKPSEMIEEPGKINCISVAMLVVGLFNELDIESEVAFTGYHFTVKFVTKNGEHNIIDATPRYGNSITGPIRKIDEEKKDRVKVFIPSEKGITAIFIANLGRELAKNGEIEEAIEVFKLGIKINPKEMYLYHQILRSLIKSDKNQEFDELVQKALEIDKEDFWPYFQIGKMLYDANKYEEAIEFFKKAIELYPNQKDLYYIEEVGLYVKIIESLQKLDKKDEADEYIEKAIENFSQDFRACRRMGIELFTLRKYEEAVKFYKKALELHTPQEYVDKMDIYAKIIESLQKLDKKDEADEYIEKAIRDSPEKYESYYSLGKLFYDIGKYEKAIEFYKKALELHTPQEKFRGKEWVYLYIMRSLQKLDKKDELIECVKEVIENFSEDFDNCLWLGNSLYDSKRYEAALMLCEQALKIKPENTDVLAKIQDIKDKQAEEKVREDLENLSKLE